MNTIPQSQRQMNHLVGGLLLSCGLLAKGPVSAQSSISPGDVSRQVEPIQVRPLPPAQPVEVMGRRPSTQEIGPKTIQVNQWLFEGNTMLASDRLRALLDQYTKVKLSKSQINEAVALVQRAYDSQGWLTRVELPPQDVTDGVIRLQIIESQLGEIVIDSRGGSRVNTKFVQSMVHHAVTSVSGVNSQRINRGLLLADDLSGVSVTGQLKAGRTEGSTDVLVRTQEEPAVLFETALDNGNARSVGEWRVLASATLLSPSGWGEKFLVQGLKSQGADFLRIGAAVPLGPSGLKANLALSSLDYRVVIKDEQGKVPDIRGNAQIFGTDLSYPWVRSRSQNLYLNAGVSVRDYTSLMGQDRASDYRIRGSQIGVKGNHFDTLGGTGSNSYSLTLVSGHLDRKVGPGIDPTQGSYGLVRLALSRQQALTKGLTIFAGLQGQYSGSKPLDGSENMILGGPSGVRAYPVGEGSGPQGLLANFELQRTISSEWLIAPFFDYGRVQKRTADNLTEYDLKGGGISLTWTGPDGWSAKASYARRIDRNPNPLGIGNKDQDGSLRRDRVWVSLNRTL
jgi:hemolysin activation/secretion protein